MSSNHVIEVKALSKYYPVFGSPFERLKQVLFSSLCNKELSYSDKDFCALNNLNFNIKKGEVVAVLGRNGSGKSTLLQTICGTLTPSKGSVKVFGRIAALLELGAGFNPEFTGRENIYLNASILGLTRKEIDKKIGDIIDFSEISAHIDQPVKHYSSGMFVRLAFSVAINVNPDVLIIDEALSVGDAKFQAKCIKKIQSIMESGTTILFVSHDITSVRTLCKRAIWIDSGNIVMDGEVFDVSSQFMQSMYDSPEEPGKDIQEIKDPHNKYVSHWGSCIGCIGQVDLLNENKEKSSVFEIDQPMTIALEYSLPTDVQEDDVNIAISIKNLKGVDLIVFSSGVSKVEKDKNIIRTEFKLTNQLSAGEYLIVVALEDNRASDGFYYEYIEGADYFMSVSKEKSQGIFNPKVCIEFS
ncbi:ABC transporter ATP-binding protein [Vibrio fluvialis]|uniref:ABC transporter ATP-binding protein n=1 Tax=Vibrio fluvialis TaxID=676 RepID=UPI00192CA757|nr:ABC transporter ATP-binding protein [Vibrio fluvialis]ELI5735290.1 ABC transporter ATP-binding protein [Vibrio fluvialis]MBL4245323.1 ABC transporter ATP-binding protein [Vibrio fluvialis]MBL4254194.1 ABC transporter ATP-binding protein [Vibrio fluvialis]MBY7933669.1 ABC transporter ATP-binding protein [Vibrio fluvialis]MBY8186409.1 ABC transporter ATP-binding protein [Vibrio fluvialis]